MTISRYDRGERSIPVEIQARDIAIFDSLFHHRWLSADHVRTLHFPNAGERATRERLRRLWLARFIDREFVPLVVPESGRRAAYAGSALYCLARAGADLVAESMGVPLAMIPHTLAANRRGFATLHHHLVVTDLLIALASRLRGTPLLFRSVREAELWERVRGRRRQGVRLPTPFVVPDGAFTLGTGGGRIETFYVEVVRADPRRGRSAILEKLERYAALNRSGFFADTWGDTHVRAVIWLAPTIARAESLRSLAVKHLTHGRQLFWFDAYAETDAAGARRTSLTSELMLTPRFRDLDGRLHAIDEDFTLHVIAHDSTSPAEDRGDCSLGRDPLSPRAPSFRAPHA